MPESKHDADRRRRRLAAIHAARRALGLDEETYRDCLQSWTGQRSAAVLDEAALDRVIELLRGLGFKRQDERVRVDPQDSAQAQMICGLWLALCQMGAAKSDAVAALNAWVKRQTSISHYRWLTLDKAQTIIESLKQWQRRVQKARSS
jgi:phage gp16-like protein